ncbi:lysostaphin resistance A-like protein [uncultured Sphingomonas sp.]|uniref:CPBP family intramembrane glutamic endopeptidase n=1 Tax=uncultured Sphingomonas sp. TaxID=158754 RepID=UPI0035CB54F3
MDDIDTTSTARRVLRHPGILLGLAILATMAGVVAISLFSLGVHAMLGRGADPAGILIVGIGAAAILSAVYAGFCRFVERRPVRELSLDNALPELGIGIGTGLALFSVVVAVIWAFGGYRVIGYHGAGVLVPALAIAISSGFTEEIFFRGFFFRLTERWLGTWAALALSAALFGALHLGNPHATLLAAVAIMLEAGIMLAAVYMLTRRLWAAIGLHGAWNFAQGGIYGIAVSGGEMDGILRPRMTGADLLTGGAFGAEASLPAIVVATAFGIMLLVVARRRGQFLAPLWIRRRRGTEGAA